MIDTDDALVVDIGRQIRVDLVDGLADGVGSFGLTALKAVIVEKSTSGNWMIWSLFASTQLY